MTEIDRPDPAPRRLTRRRVLVGSGVGGALALTGGAAWAADRFLVAHVEVTGASTLYEDASATATASSSATTATTSTDTSWSGSTGAVNLKSVATGSGATAVTYFVADITLSTPTGLRSAFAKDTFGENVIEVPSVMAERVGAVVAINGDYYGFRTTGIEIRNGATFRDRGARQGLVIGKEGSFRLYDETTTNAAQLLAEGAWHTLSFGPGLIDGGAVLSGIDTIEIDTNVGNHSIQGYQPRTAIGMIAPGHVVFVVVDGRSTGYSRGMTLPELAQMMKGLGCQVAYNLDGGGSSALWFNGDIRNKPQGTDKERGTSDIFYLGA
jgi:exopolysaccharide biosynthesis protein